MKPNKSPLSIKIIYYLTQFAFWSAMLGSAFILLFFVGHLTGVLHDDTETALDIPVRFDLLETGTLEAYGQQYQVVLKDASGTFEFNGLPKPVIAVVLLLTLGLIALGVTEIVFFRKFIKNVYQGFYFTAENIGYLKKMAYTLMGIWLYILIVSNVASGFAMSTMDFEHIKFTGIRTDSSSVLFAALFLWVLSHIFSQGLQLKTENELTV